MTNRQGGAAARSTRRALRVAAPWSLTRHPPNTSADRVWSHGLDALGQRVDLRFRHPTGRRTKFSSGDVWLTDGHQGAIAVKRPVVIHLYEASWDDPESAHTLAPAFVERYRELSAAAVAAASQIITISEHSRRQIVRAYDVDPDVVHVAHLGLDHDVHHPGLDGGARIVADAGGSAEDPYVLFVGTVHPRKNLPVLRQAVEALNAQGLPHRLVLVSGPAPDRGDSDELVAAATEAIGGRDVVNLAGISEPDLARVMADAAVLCLPSLSEGFGMPVAEAMACGTPVVVADRGALPEVVGDAGVLVEPDVDALTAGLAAVLNDPERARLLGRQGAERASRFTWSATADVWTSVLERAAGRSDGPHPAPIARK